MGLIAGNAQWCDPQGGPGDTRGAEGCIERGNATLTFGATREKFSLGTLVEVTREHHCAELETQVADQEEQGNTDGAPLGGLVVDVGVGDREVGARLVGIFTTFTKKTWNKLVRTVFCVRVVCLYGWDFTLVVADLGDEYLQCGFRLERCVAMNSVAACCRASSC